MAGNRWPVSCLVCLVGTTSIVAQDVAYEEGPLTGRLGSVATIELPEGYGFVDKAGMPAFNAATGNLHNPQDVGALFPLDDAQAWTVFFSFDPVGYVEDADKDELDADEIMQVFQEGDGPSNEERRRHGVPELHTVGWSRPPYYDERTNNLTWGLRLRSDAGPIVNHQVRLLGRHGVMQVVLVADPEGVEPAVGTLDELLAGFTYVPGETYAEYARGDRIAAYGLGGLVLGGGILAAAKTGLLAKLGKFLKPILIGVAVVFAGLWRRIKGLFGGGRSRTSAEL